MKSGSKLGLSSTVGITVALMLCFALLTGSNGATNRTSSVPPLPPSLSGSTSTNYFYVTAYDSQGRQSDPSNTVESDILPISLAWNPSPDTNVSDYVLYWSRDNVTFQAVADAGTNLTVAWPIVLTNRIFEITAHWIATNPPTQFYSLCIKTNLNGPWTPLDNAPKTIIVTPF